MSRPPVFTNRCCKLVSDHFPIRNGEQGDDATPYVFTSLRGGPMTRRTVHHVVAEAAKAAGIGFPVHPHMLRHATGCFLANAG